MFASSAAFAYLRCSASCDAPGCLSWSLRFSMWAVARLRSASATVELVSDVAADAGPFLLLLLEAEALAGSGLNFSNIVPSCCPRSGARCC